MSAEVETMAYVSNEENERLVPWHGLGTPVEKAMTSAEAIQLAGLDWDVVGKPIFSHLGKEIDGYVANTRSSDDSVLGVVTNKYRVVQNREAFEFTDSLIGEGVTYETAGSLKKGKHVWLLAKLPETKILDDAVEPFVVFSNAHDGTGAVKVAMTPIRVVCQNTLNLALKEARRCWSARHMGDMAGKLDDAKRTLELANTYIEELDVEADKLANIDITPKKLEEFYNKLFPVDLTKDSPRKITTTQEARNAFARCLSMPDISKFNGSAWGVMMAATDFADHVAPARMSKNYRENNWGKIMGGHPFVDKVYELVTA